MLKERFYSVIIKFIPNLWYFLDYRYAAKVLGDSIKKRNELFGQLIKDSRDKKCLQIGVRNKKYGSNWVSDDLYCHDETIDFHYDVCDLKFDNELFEIVTCIAILEHVNDPFRAVQELHRVLKKGGLIWIEIPFNQPYHASPNDYWRVTISGMKILMKDFEEISSGFFKIERSPIYNSIYFYGRKAQ